MNRMSGVLSLAVTCAVSLAVICVMICASAARVSAEETPWYRFGTPGLVLADLSPQLLLDGDALPDPGMVLADCSSDPDCVNGGATDYRITGLPDLDLGDSGTYSLVWSYNGVSYTYYWPSRTSTPVATINRVSVQITQNPVKLGPGATEPAAGLTIYGLNADPTGSVVTFSMWDQSGTKVLDGVSATVVGTEALIDGTYSLTVVHNWLASETASVGSYYARFNITLPGGGVMIQPPERNRLGVEIYAP